MFELPLKLYKNTLYAGISMAANLVLPLAATPFLLKSLGEHSFGELAIAQAMTILMSQVVDFGFSLGASREIATKNTNESVSRVYNHYQNARLLLLLFVLFALFTAIILLPHNFSATPTNVLAATIIPYSLGLFFQSNWFFHGRAQYGWLAAANVIGKATYLTLAVLVIDSSNDLLLAGLAFGFSQLISGLILQAALIKMQIRLSIDLSIRKNLKTIKNSTENFASIALLSIHTQLIIVLTGHFAGAKVAGDISVIDKVIRGISAIIFPLANSAFSRLSQLHHSDTKAAAKLHGKLVAIILTCAVITSSFFVLFGETLITRAFKIDTEHLKILIFAAAPMPFFIAIGLLYGGLKLIPLGRNREYLVTIASGEVFGLMVFFICLNFSKDVSGLIAISAAEFFIGIGMYLSAKFKLHQK